MECQFSEFSYGYAATREAEQLAGEVYTLAGAPILPSLRDEARRGWDVSINTAVEWSLFLQFKRPDYVSQRHPSSPTWAHANNPHYRVSIDANGNQHAQLHALEGQITAGHIVGEVLYSAPLYWRRDDFHARYDGGRVLEDSLLFAPREFALGSGKHHYVVVEETGAEIVLSKPREPSTRRSTSSLRARLSDLAGSWEGRAEADAERPSLADLERYLLSLHDERNADRPLQRSSALELAPADRVRNAAARVGMSVAMLLAPTA